MIAQFVAKGDLKRLSFWISRLFANFKIKLETQISELFFFFETAKTVTARFSESGSEIRLFWRESDWSWPSDRVFVSNQRRPSHLDGSPDLKRPYKWRDLLNWEPYFIFSPAVKYRNYIYWLSILTAGKLLVGRTKSGTLLLGPKYCDPWRIEVS